MALVAVRGFRRSLGTGKSLSFVSRLAMRVVTIIGWFLSLALLIGIAGPLFGTCTQGDDSPWSSGLLVFAPVGLVGLTLARIGARAAHRYWWLVVPHIATAIVAAYLIPTYFSQTTLAGRHVCAVREGNDFTLPVTLTQQLWAPSWLAIVTVLGYVVFACWGADRAKQHG